MPEDVEMVEGTPEEATAIPDSVDQETLAPESPEPETSEANPEETAPSEFDLEAEQEFELLGKSYKLTGKALQEALENSAKLAEKERSLNRDYTQKTQQLSEQRKSIESAFGRMPEPQELQALGQVWKTYFENPDFAKVVDSVLAGQPLSTAVSQPGQGSQSPEVAALNQEIRTLKAHLSQFTSGYEQEKKQSAYNEGKRNFDSWMKAKTEQGITVDESKIDAILETAGLLMKRNSDWDVPKALDEALRRETIDSVERATAKKVLTNADKAKKAGTIRITPKSVQKPVSEMSYAEIIKNAS